jgi:acyl-coenzyme A synthetase/AMP-(fatty) acid ligase
LAAETARTAKTVANDITLLSPDRPDRAVVWHDGRAVTQAGLLHEARRLARQLPERSHVINDCRDRYSFLVAFLAAILRGQITVLPNDRTQRVAMALLDRFPGLYCLSDQDGGFEGLEAVAVAPGRDAEDAAAGLPAVDAERTAAIVFTSGSTGQPQPNEKTLGTLAATAGLIARRFGLEAEAPAAVVATVPPQHMYGLETSISLPLWTSVSVHSERPFYPADIAAALREVSAPRALVTTPIHLRALVSARVKLPDLRMVISATAPLSEQLAARIERRFQTEVFEIYGFSEAGTVATRRTVEGPRWTTCDGLSVRRDGETCYVEAPHLGGAVAMNDLVDILSPQEFVLRGRISDAVNIAGKRTSLSGLNAILNEIEGVADGTFFMDDRADDTRVGRLFAFVVAPGRSGKDIKAALRRQIDPAFLPRQVYLVPELPRAESGKLTREALCALAAQLVEDRG